MRKIKTGELLLLLSKEESYLVEAKNIKFHTKSGVIDLRRIVGRRYGEKIKTHLGKEFIITKPTIKDILDKKLERLPQIIMPKDAALILAYTNIPAGSLVVDAGCGSGFLAIFLANYVRPGRVVTYEIDKRFIKLAKENIRKSELGRYIKLKEKDILKGIDEKNVDLITLDMKDARKVVKHANRALKPGGWLVVYSPTVEHMIATRREIEKLSFSFIKTVENIVREWQVKKYTRPKTLGIMHTGFLTFARKVC